MISHVNDSSGSVQSNAQSQDSVKLNETQWQKSFFFIQIADCQLGFFENNASWETEKDLLLKCVMKINELKPLFVILCGDMTHARPFEAKYSEQVADYKKIVAKIDPSIPLICLCGNHDVGDRPTPATIAAYESNFNRHYFSFWAGGVHCIALNSSLLANPADAPKMDSDQNEWFIKELETSNLLHPAHRFIFTHHSWFLVDPNEEDTNFVIPKEKRLKLLEIIEKNGCTACFSGHYHRNAYGKYKNIEMITTSAVGRPLGKDPSGYRIVEVTKECIKHAYYSLEIN